MSKRRWLERMIEETRKAELDMPWTTLRETRREQVALATLTARGAQQFHANLQPRPA